MNVKHILCLTAGVSITLGVSACKPTNDTQTQNTQTAAEELTKNTQPAAEEPQRIDRVKELLQKCDPKFENSNAQDSSENCDFDKMKEITADAEALVAFYEARNADDLQHIIRTYQQGYDECMERVDHNCLDDSACDYESDRLKLFSTIVDTAREAIWFKTQNQSDINRLLKLELVLATDESSDFQKIEKMIADGADINIKYKDGKTPIFYAQNKTVFEKLVSLGAKLDVTDNMGNSLLHTANDREIVKLLIAAKLNVNAQNKRNETPLFLHRDDRAISTLLIQNGAKTEMRDLEGNSFWNGTTLEKAETFKSEFTKDYPGDTLGLTILPDGSTPFLNTYGMYSTQLRAFERYDPINLGIKELKEKLMALEEEYGPKIKQTSVANAKDAKGNTLLFYASSAKLADILLKLGANPNERNLKGETPIFHSPLWITNRLIKAGADLTIKNVLGQTPIFTNDDCSSLIAAGADVNIRDKNNKTPLFYHLTYVVGGFDHGPALNINKSAIKALINAGADINAKDKEGQTVLFHGLGTSNDYQTDEDEEGKLLVEYLVEAGADVNARDNLGRTAIMLSYRKDEIEYLLEHGADVNIKDNAGKSAIDYHKEREDIVELIQSKMKP